MDYLWLDSAGKQALEQVLGYANFSSGAPDPKLLSALNELYALVEGGRSGTRLTDDEGTPTCQVIGQALQARLAKLSVESPTYADAQQGQAVLSLVFQHLLPAYLKFHKDLLFHQTWRTYYRPFMLGRMFEAVLRQGAPWDDITRIVDNAITYLNDFLGHRPVAVLQSRRIEPYAHERVRPIPIYVEGADVAVGRYHDVVKLALSLLKDTNEDLLRDACFDPAMLEEFAIDPRAYDFDHPANKRPNYHFGQWDPHRIDNQGNYRRFITQQVTLDSLLARVEQGTDAPREELMLEAAAVLAGTILMAAGVSGGGPETHDSTTTLSSLLQRIAAYRDAFYEQLLGRLKGKHAKRLTAEAAERRQPFGAARQHLNAQLARRRAVQLEHVHLARIFARMDYAEAATRQTDAVSVASARMLTQMDCRFAAIQHHLVENDLPLAFRNIQDVIDLLHRGIECGALVDPWNILGFDAHYSLFPALENSVRDVRVEELLSVIERLVEVLSKIWSEAAAHDDAKLSAQVSECFSGLANWWHQFAAHEVSSVDALDAMQSFRAAEQVASALNQWHKGGAATGDVRFWAQHASSLTSPKAYALIVNALLDKEDMVASMALLAHWLGQADEVGLQEGDTSLESLMERWVRQLRAGDGTANLSPEKRWSMIRKFLDHLEANADSYWHAPPFNLAGPRAPANPAHDPDQGEEADDPDGIYGAAYEEVVYRDSTDDGMQGAIFDPGQSTSDELEMELPKISSHLSLLTCVCEIFRTGAVEASRFSPDDPQRWDTVRHWLAHTLSVRRELVQLLDAVQAHRIGAPRGDHDAMIDYDRRRLMKETLLERIVSGTVEVAHASHVIIAALLAGQQLPPEDAWQALETDEKAAINVMAAIFSGDVPAVKLAWKPLLLSLAKQPLLYVPLARGGLPKPIVRVRVRQQTLHDLLASLPRLGLLNETRELIETSRKVERANPVGPGAVTEFDGLFETGYRAMVETLVAASGEQPDESSRVKSPESSLDGSLADCLEQLTESLLQSWLAHSRTLRLSVLEKVSDESAWKELVGFIQRFGGDLFTQRFLNLGNIRAILHEGMETWFEQMEELPPSEGVPKLIEELGTGYPRDTAAEKMTLVLEAIVEHYGEYRDYNSTTTQSDRGEMLYSLLDFLRLQQAYERIVWNLKPVVLAHEILVRGARHEAAHLWRQALAERTADEADQYLNRLAKLQKQYAMRMPTVADRLAERFIRPLEIDRLRALIEPAMHAADDVEREQSFQALEIESAALAQEPTGVGLDVPAWLAALEDEVDQALLPPHEREESHSLASLVLRLPLTLDEARLQMDTWEPLDLSRRDE